MINFALFGYYFITGFLSSTTKSRDDVWFITATRRRTRRNFFVALSVKDDEEEDILLNEMFERHEGISLKELQETSYNKIHYAINGDAGTSTRKVPQIILLGEATHGTVEFYQIRCEITKSLLETDNNTYCYDAIVCEGSFSSFWDTNNQITTSIDKSSSIIMSEQNNTSILQNTGIFRKDIQFLSKLVME